MLKIFLFCFSKFSLTNNELPLKLYKNTVAQQTNLHDFENEFYKLFAETRSILIKELQTTDENIEKIGLNKDDSIHYAQLILNRYIFLCFAEDKNLLPADITIKTLMNALEGGLYETELWDNLTKLFRYVNEGFPTKNINKFNGGLFREKLKKLHIRDYVPKNYFNECYTNYNFTEHENTINEILDKYRTIYKDKYNENLIINPLFRNLLLISSFDFDSEVDVNILGHIFENSISDLEELKGETTNKRKKDGVFYTPDYITDYICKNTILPYLSKNGKSTTIDELIQEYNTSTSDLKILDDKLKNIKIVDPACGSGAFLNKATDILLEIHEKLWTVLYKDDVSLDKYFDNNAKRREIIINNIYGVDLNESSVEITKLGMFLKVATKDTTLPVLDKNIKQGNSLISDKEFSEDAFIWEEEFQEVFNNGGFDIVIGNPPYVKEATNKNAFNGVRNSPYYQGKMDLWYLFGCKSIDLIKDNGFVSFIATNNWITSYGASKFRNKVNNEVTFKFFIDFKNYKVFESADIQTMIYLMIKNNEQNNYSFTYRKLLNDNIDKEKMTTFLYSNNEEEWFEKYIVNYNREENKDNYFNFIEKTKSDILDKIKENKIFLDKNEVSQGIVSPQDFLNKKGSDKIDLPMGSGIFIISNEEKENLNLNNNELNLIKPYYTTNEIKRYYSDKINKFYVIYTKSDINENINQYPHIKKHLDKFEKVITSSNKPYGLHRARKEEIFQNEKIIVTRKCVIPTFSYTNFDSYVSQTFMIIKTDRFDLKYLTGLLNSKLIQFWLKYKGKMQGNNYQLDKEPLLKIPLIQHQNNEEKIKEKINDILNNLESYYTEINLFKEWIKRTFKIDKLSNEFETYYELTLEQFLIELEKKKVDIKSRNTQELLKREFDNSKNIIIPLKNQIEETDDEINQLVYELYNLTPEEIAIIEESLQN